VAGDDGVAVVFLGGEGEELVAHLAGRLFDAAAILGGYLADRAFAGDRFEPERGRVVAHETEVGGGVVAELMVEVGNGELEAETLAQGKQEMQAGERIGPARDGNEQAGAPVEEALGVCEPFDANEGPGEGRAVSVGRAAATRCRLVVPAGRAAG
jgi:hypothetical protein